MRKLLVIIGAILLVAGIILAGMMYGAYQGCTGIVGKITTFLSPETNAKCGTYSFFLIAGFGLFIVGLVLLFLGLFLKQEKS